MYLFWSYMNNQRTTNHFKNRPRCYTKSPTVQDAFWPIPGLISCAGSCYPSNQFLWYLKSILQITHPLYANISCVCPHILYNYSNNSLYWTSYSVAIHQAILLQRMLAIIASAILHTHAASLYWSICHILSQFNHVALFNWSICHVLL